MVEIGKPERTIIVEPAEDPVPRKEPVEAPAKPEPVKVPEKEPVPA